MHSSFPAPIYRDTVLVQIFEDAKRFFLEPLLAIQYAHTLMLTKSLHIVIAQKPKRRSARKDAEAAAKPPSPIVSVKTEKQRKALELSAADRTG